MVNNNKIVADIIGFARNKLRNYVKENSSKIIYSTGKDIKITTDKELNAIIVEYLKANYEYPIISEESNPQVDINDLDDFVWIIDPLDGSLNYHRGIPLFCTSIALWYKDKPKLGLIYEYSGDNLFYTFDDGAIAYLNGNKITTSDISDKSNAVICTGFPSGRQYDKESLARFVDKVRKWKKVRLIGSAAISLAWVATGKVDAYIEEDIYLWDVAAGLAIVNAAGGAYRTIFRRGKNKLIAAATNNVLAIEDLL